MSQYSEVKLIVTMYVLCLWFGGDEYQGIDPDHPYSYCPHTESLEEDEGYDINWRTVGVDNDSSDDDDE